MRRKRCSLVASLVAHPHDARVTRPGTGHAGGRLSTRAPFHLEATVRVLQRRPTNLVETWERGRYLRVLRTSGDLALVEVENRGTIDEPDVRYSLRHGDSSTEAQRRLAQTLRKVLGLDVDPLPLQRIAEADRKLRPTALALRGMRPPRFAGWFEAFANVMPFQQLSLDAGIAIVGRLVRVDVDAVASCTWDSARRSSDRQVPPPGVEPGSFGLEHRCPSSRATRAEKAPGAGVEPA